MLINIILTRIPSLHFIPHVCKHYNTHTQMHIWVEIEYNKGMRVD